MVWHQPFDLYYWFVNVLAGSWELFLAMSFLTIATLTGMFRMPTVITGIAFALFVIMLSAYTGTLYILVLFVLALIFGWALAKLIKS